MSDFMIGTTIETLTALNELTVPVDDPQPEYRKFVKKDKLADGSYKGRGPAKVFWGFSLLEVAQVEQMNEFLSADPIYIQSRDKNDDPQVYWVLMNVPDPREDGEHERRMKGFRSDYLVEFIVLTEVEGS